MATVTEVGFGYGGTVADDRECVVGRAGYQGVWSQSPARWPTQVATASPTRVASGISCWTTDISIPRSSISQNPQGFPGDSEGGPYWT